MFMEPGLGFKFWRRSFFIILFAWISFFPEPLQATHSFYTRIFLFLFLISLFLDKKYRSRLFESRDWPLWLFLAGLSAGTISAIDKTLALKTYSYLVLTFLPLYYIGKGLFPGEEGRNKVSLVICVCSGLAALVGLLELYFGKNVLYENFIANPFYERYSRYFPRPMATLLNPAVLGSYLLGCLPFSLYLRNSRQLWRRCLSIGVLTLSCGIIFLTFSRGVFLGFIAMVPFYLWQTKRKRSALIFFLILLILVAACSFTRDVNLGRFGFERFIFGSYDSIFSEYRFSRIKMTLGMLRDYPLFGIGFNHFRPRFAEYCDIKESIFTPHEFRIPDNMYLTFLAETGIIGLIGFLIFIFILFKRGLSYVNGPEEAPKRYSMLIVLCAFTGLMVNMGAYELFYWSNPYMLFCLIAGFSQAR